MYNLKFVNFKVFDLGKEYLLNWYSIKNKPIKVKLIKVTPKGYNFLNIKNNKCIFKRHMYINKRGSIVLPKSLMVSNFEIETSLGEDKFIHIKPFIY